MTHPRDFDRRMETNRNTDSKAGPWGWVTGAVFIFVVLILVLTSGNYEKTASNNMDPPALMTPSHDPLTTG